MVKFEPDWPRRRLTGHLTWFALWLGVTLVAALLHPDSRGHGTHMQLGLPPCPSVALFGLLCPGCGLTTSFAALAHGRIDLAFEAHPFGPILYALFTLSAFACLFGWWNRRRFDTNSVAANVAIAVLVCAFFGYGIWRAWRYPLRDHSIMERLGLHLQQATSEGGVVSLRAGGVPRHGERSSP